MRLSVAMCTYNGARYLEEQLHSFTTQQRMPDELVVCDDRSADETPAILERFARNAPFPTRLLLNPENLGYSRNFAQAIELCTGDLIALSDQDDVWYPQKLERLVDAFRADPGIEAAFSNGNVIDEASQPMGRTLWQSFLFNAAEQARFRSGAAVDVLLRRNVVTGMAFAFRSSAKNVLPPMPATWMHDGWLAMLLAMRSRIAVLPECLVGYRVHGTQQVGTPLTLSGKVRLFQQKGFQAYLHRLHAHNLKDYRSMADQFDDLSAWLETSSQDQVLKAKVRAKADHAHRGVKALSLGRLSRVPLLLPHVKEYASFSPNGLRGLPRDLVA